MSKKTLELIEKGVNLAYRRMLEEKAKNDEEIIISENGEIVRIKARDVLEELKRKGEI
jgi:hypothetical protein